MQEHRMKKLICEFEGLKKHMRESGLKFKQAITRYYAQLGEKQGFTVVEGSSVVKNAFNYGKIDLMWVEPNVCFAQEYGSLEELMGKLFQVMVLQPKICVLILSGASQCNPKKARELVDKTKQLSDIEFYVLDVTKHELC